MTNSGNCNSGNCNSGNHNAGHHNSGDYNSGHGNSGNCNSGNYNSGNRNAGDYNSGNRNSGHYNSGHYNSGFFNTDEPTVRMFNKDTKLKWKDIYIPFMFLPIAEWVPFKEGISPEKARVTGGCLIKRTYKEAWAIAWSNLSEKHRQRFRDLPNFCPKIFEEITGVNPIGDIKVQVVANGKEVFISKESAVALGLLEDD